MFVDKTWTSYSFILFLSASKSVLHMMSSKVYQGLLCLETLLFARAFTPFAPESSHKCYFIDGNFDAAGGPCYGNVGASMCCYGGEQCVEGSGLCLAEPNGVPGPYDNGSSIWRRSCTDVTWQDGACLAIAYGESHCREATLASIL